MQPGVKLASYWFSRVNVNWNDLRVKFAPIAKNPGRFGPGSFRPGSFWPGSFPPNSGVGRFGLGRWVDSALGRFGPGSFRLKSIPKCRLLRTGRQTNR